MKEGSFEGLMSGLDFNTDPNLKNHQPTPDELPKKIDLTNVPENILRANVMESLISQNDDLMARLNVSLRRISLLEEKYTDAKTETGTVRAKYDNLRDQVLILKEQAKVLADRNREISDKTKREGQGQQELKEQIKLLEVRYAELFTASRERHAKLEVEIARADRVVTRYQKYRAGIRRALIFIREEIKTLRSKRSVQDATILDLRKNLQESTTYITEQGKEHKNAVIGLTATYETQIKGLQSEIDMLVEQNKTLGARSQELDRIQSEKIRLENDLIITERRIEDLQMQSSAEINDVQKALARYRNDCKELSIDLDDRNRSVEVLTNENAAFTSERAAMTEQVETLQLLWRDQQNQVEKLNEQKSALQRLNQELSVTVNENRREIRELKEQVEAETLKLAQYQREHDIRQKVSQIVRDKAAQKGGSSGSTGGKSGSGKNAISDETIVLRADKTPELIAKIDQALSQLHVGK